LNREQFSKCDAVLMRLRQSLSRRAAVFPSQFALKVRRDTFIKQHAHRRSNAPSLAPRQQLFAPE
jgi:hypothetical protein